jgi:hopanoid C-3 methylase
MWGQYNEARGGERILKILLIEPPKSPVTIGGEEVFLFEPLALEYVAAGVAGHHDVRILDMRLDKGLASVLRDFRPEVVGFTAYTVHVNTVCRLARDIKTWNRDTVTVVGGHHATVAPTDFAVPQIDLVVTGEGIEPFCEIIRRHEARKGFQGIPGVAFHAENGFRIEEAGTGIELDAAPLPARSLTALYRKHYYCEWMKPLASIRTSKGCPHRCSFCAEWKTAHGRYLKRSPDRVVEELARIDEECLFFADDESLVDVGRMARMASLIKQADIRKRYFLYGRSDTIARHPELLKCWRDIGLERVFIGMEFVRDADLEYIRKRSTVSDNEQAVKVLQDLGIDIYASFIIRPEFSREDFAAYRSYCRRLGLNFATFSVLTPLPGTDLFEEVKDRLLTRNFDYYDFIHTLLPTKIPLNDFFAELTGLYLNAIPPLTQLAMLKRYSLRDIPPLLGRSRRAFARLRTISRDYDELSWR